jgi:hypothetical protein
MFQGRDGETRTSLPAVRRAETADDGFSGSFPKHPPFGLSVRFHAEIMRNALQ